MCDAILVVYLPMPSPLSAYSCFARSSNRPRKESESDDSTKTALKPRTDWFEKTACFLEERTDTITCMSLLSTRWQSDALNGKGDAYSRREWQPHVNRTREVVVRSDGRRTTFRTSDKPHTDRQRGGVHEKLRDAHLHITQTSYLTQEL